MSTEQEAMEAARRQVEGVSMQGRMVTHGPDCIKIARALIASEARAASAHRAGMEEAARILDERAQEWNRRRDPGMANHDRSMAKVIRCAAKEHQDE